MESIINTIITGIFTLIGIWLTYKLNNTQDSKQQEPNDTDYNKTKITPNREKSNDGLSESDTRRRNIRSMTYSFLISILILVVFDKNYELAFIAGMVAAFSGLCLFYYLLRGFYYLAIYFFNKN